MIKTVRREDSVIGGNGEKELAATGAKYIATRLALYIFGNENKSLGTCFDWEIGCGVIYIEGTPLSKVEPQSHDTSNTRSKPGFSESLSRNVTSRDSPF